ncbi:hypothetical protein A5656_28385 [Mycobacterium gordonae]|nr:hypothetical protein [Mycobacterium gordonae]OBK49406.1 hypothetical protein A5656_28385 [Mycobacterium gordonae]
MTEPTLRILSLGAGVQSTTLALMACEGILPGLDGAIFADTGWEPGAVYRQVRRLAENLWHDLRIPTFKVTRGNIRTDTTDPTKRFLSLPWYTLAPEGTKRDPIYHEDAVDDEGNPVVVGYGPERQLTRREREGIGRRQCTAEYKLAMINRKARELLGAPPPKFRTVPRGRIAEQWIGFSTDEISRVNDKPQNLYTTQRYPLLELGMSRTDCELWLKSRGWGHTVKSACIGCPLHSNAMWRDMRDNRPHEWRQAVEFDRQIRKGGARGPKLRGEAFLHRSRVPLDQAPIDYISANEWASRQTDLLHAIKEIELMETGPADGCSPYGCRSGDPVELDEASA